jgi:type II secretory ATPase GspE/PulE/Tfp pilus assembly ATPase PilB-like protein
LHWIARAAMRAGLARAELLTMLPAVRIADAWKHACSGLGVSSDDLASALAPALGIALADFRRASAQARRLLPEDLVRKHRIFALREDDRTITVATADPTDVDAEQAVGFAAGRRVAFELAAPDAIDEAIDATSSPEDGVQTVLATFVDAQMAFSVRVVDDSLPEEVRRQEIEGAPIVRLTSALIHNAVIQGASDIHIEPGPRNGAVRFRVDGVLRQFTNLPIAVLNRVVSRIKVLGGLDIADRLRPQDGSTRMEVDGTVFDLRISTIPTRDSEKAVIRLLRPDAATSLEEIGITNHELGRLRYLIGHRDGIVIVTGPTGSGKTTTMYAAIKGLAIGSVNIMTVEDPIEYELAGITQIQVEPKRDVTFAKALRAMLRQDPDVIFVGEIRDLETAQIAVQASMTGHLVLATLHTNDAMSAVARLVDIGLDRPSIATSLRGCLAQRLVRRLCTACAQPIGEHPTEEEARLGQRAGVRPFMRAVGCPQCAHTGYRGRAPIEEVAIISPEMAEQIESGASTAALHRSALAGGMRMLRDVAIELVSQGTTTLQEIDRVLGENIEDAPGHRALTPLAVTAVPSDAPRPQSPAESPPAPAPSLSVLVVDDEAVQRRLVSSVLERNGFSVRTASDGAEALRHLGAGYHADLVLTDLHMPGVDGAALLARLRAIPHTATLPVIVLTSEAEEDVETTLIDAGADDYIRKPFEPARLISRVRAGLRRAGVL